MLIILVTNCSFSLFSTAKLRLFLHKTIINRRISAKVSHLSTLFTNFAAQLIKYP